MSSAEVIYNKLGLSRDLRCDVLIPILKELSELADNYQSLLGSKRSYYNFSDGSRIVWHAGIAKFEVQND